MNIDARTRIFLLLGDPVRHSLSPLLHNAAFRALNLNYVYLAAPVRAASLQAAVSGLRALGLAGANVTIPYKEAVLPYLDLVSPEALAIGSVNTIVHHDGKLTGSSTDGDGFLRAAREEGLAELFSDPILMIGAGGAARAIADALIRQGATDLMIANRTAARAQALVEWIKPQSPLVTAAAVLWQEEALRQACSRCRVLIYCLPGDFPEVTKALNPLPGQGKALFDLRYHPAETEVMRLFRSRGGKAVNGRGMLLWQAALAFELFTGQKAPVEVMRRAVDGA
ncbi:MAG: shikimate dehydrogenase [Bacillota bacterium]